MRLWLEFFPDMAALHVLDGGHRTEIRGHPGIGTTFCGDRLDRVLSGLPKRVNISLLFADQVATAWGDDKETIRALLRKEDEMVELLKSSKLATPQAMVDRKRITRRDMRRLREATGLLQHL